MIGVLVLTGFTWWILALRGAPHRLRQGVVIGGTAFALMIGVIDPGARPDPAAFASWGKALVFASLAAVPIGVYVIFLRRLRERANPGTSAKPAHPTGFVLIEDDAALTREVLAKFAVENAAHAPWDREAFSIAYRDTEGEVTASGHIILNMGLAEFRRIWVEPSARGKGLGAALLAKMEEVARDKGARRAALDTYSWQAEGLYAKAGYREVGRLAYPAGAERIYMSKDLV